MDFNFYDQYKNYPSIDLLKIVRSPDSYQPQAIEAATQVLKEREVTAEEIALADGYILDIKRKQEKIEAYKEKAKDFLQPILQPGPHVKPAKWLNILLILVALDYCLVIYQTIRRAVSFLWCDYCTFDPLFFSFSLLGIIYVPFIFYLLFKRKRWGWILLFVDNGITAIGRLSQMYMYFEYRDIHGGDIATYLFFILIKVGFLIFLWRNEITAYFDVPDQTKQRTLIFLAVIAALALLFHLIN